MSNLSALLQASQPALEAHACGCIGPQNGQPLCPCMMRSVRIEDGRYIERRDHGPVVPEFDARSREAFRRMLLDGMTKGVTPTKPRRRVKAGSRVVA